MSVILTIAAQTASDLLWLGKFNKWAIVLNLPHEKERIMFVLEFGIVKLLGFITDNGRRKYEFGYNYI